MHHRAPAPSALTALQGFEGFLASKDMQRKRTRTLKDEERAFSLSSRTSAVVSALHACTHKTPSPLPSALLTYPLVRPHLAFCCALDQ